MARSIGITPMAIYHHFATREALLRAVVDREFGEFLDLIGKTPTVDTTEGQIVHALDAYMEYALSRPRIFDYVFSKPRDDAVSPLRTSSNWYTDRCDGYFMD